MKQPNKDEVLQFCIQIKKERPNITKEELESLLKRYQHYYDEKSSEQIKGLGLPEKDSFVRDVSHDSVSSALREITNSEGSQDRNFKQKDNSCLTNDITGEIKIGRNEQNGCICKNCGTNILEDVDICPTCRMSTSKVSKLLGRHFAGIICSCCDFSINHNDEVVVCPKCKEPYHARCWEKNGLACAIPSCQYKTPEPTYEAVKISQPNKTDRKEDSILCDDSGTEQVKYKLRNEMEDSSNISEEEGLPESNWKNSVFHKKYIFVCFILAILLGFFDKSAAVGALIILVGLIIKQDKEIIVKFYKTARQTQSKLIMHPKYKQYRNRTAKVSLVIIVIFLFVLGYSNYQVPLMKAFANFEGLKTVISSNPRGSEKARDAAIALLYSESANDKKAGIEFLAEEGRNNGQKYRIEVAKRLFELLGEKKVYSMLRNMIITYQVPTQNDKISTIYYGFDETIKMMSSAQSAKLKYLENTVEEYEKVERKIDILTTALKNSRSELAKAKEMYTNTVSDNERWRETAFKGAKWIDQGSKEETLTRWAYGDKWVDSNVNVAPKNLKALTEEEKKNYDKYKEQKKEASSRAEKEENYSNRIEQLKHDVPRLEKEIDLAQKEVQRQLPLMKTKIDEAIQNL